MRAVPPERLRILVVDDEREIRELLGEYLSARGNDVHTVGDGLQALDWLKGNPVDVLLTDIQMPLMAGVELVATLHSQQTNIGIVVMTGFPTVETATTALKMGASDYVQKPFRLRDIYKAVQRAAGRGRLERQLSRLEVRSRFYEHLIAAPVDQRTTHLADRLPALLAVEVEARACALWLRQDRSFCPVIAPVGALETLSLIEVVAATLDGALAAVPLPDDRGVLAVEASGPIREADLARLEILAGVIARLLPGA